jgi:hypothetical protein
MRHATEPDLDRLETLLEKAFLARVKQALGRASAIVARSGRDSG